MNLAKVYDPIAEDYEKRRLSNLELEENRAVCKYLLDSGYVDQRVVEQASGVGTLIDYLDEFIPPDRYLGVEVSSEMASIAKAKHPNYTFSINDPRRMPLMPEVVEFAVSLFGRYNDFLSDMERDDALREALRVLRPRGRVLLMLYSAWAIEQRILEVRLGTMPILRRVDTAARWLAWMDRACEAAKLRGMTHRWTRWAPRWLPRAFWRAYLWIEARTLGKWFPNSCVYLILEAKKPVPPPLSPSLSK